MSTHTSIYFAGVCCQNPVAAKLMLRRGDSTWTKFPTVFPRRDANVFPRRCMFIFVALASGITMPPLSLLRRPPPMFEKPTDDAFERAVKLCERRLRGERFASLRHVPKLMQAAFDADGLPDVERTNVTCLCPNENVDGQGLLDDELVAMQAQHTHEARQCIGGGCSDACSRLAVPTFASREECEALIAGVELITPPLKSHDEYTLSLAELCASSDVETTLTFIRILERLRRLVAHEYGLPRERIFVENAFVSRIPAQAPQDAYGRLHADESSCADFHYSGVLHLRTAGDGFKGGDFVFSDKARGAEEQRADPLTSRSLTRMSPLQGRAVLFSSGWENIHYVSAVSSGVRYAMPCFFRTEAATEGGGAYDHVDDMCHWLMSVWSSPGKLAALQREVESW